MARVLVGCDVGGTFTDAYAHEPDGGRVALAKAPTTPQDQSQGAIHAVQDALDRLGSPAGDVARVIHGTTTATNALLEGDLARVALVTNEGFQDLIEIGRQDRPSVYDPSRTRPDALVAREDRYTVPGRLGPDGDEVTPVDAQTVDEVGRALADDGVQAVAVCLLHAYQDPGHETQVAQGLAKHLDSQVPVVASHEVSPEIREVERFTTTVLNAGLVPRVQAYLDRLTDQLTGIGIQAPVEVLDSAGSLMTPREAAGHPVRTLLSGPAGGAAACQHVGRVHGQPDLIGIDMGGTSTDVTMLQDGVATQRWEAEVAGYRLQVPVADIHTVGAGGGSIAWIDEAGGLHVGPRSAGADPGPACYGRGGEAPTVTDASLVLGRIPAGARLAGGMTLDGERATRAIDPIAGALGTDTHGAARAILEVALARTVRGIRVLAARNAVDPEATALVPFGGAGPLFGVAWATELGVPRVIVPADAGVCSAMGLLAAQPRVERARSLVARLDETALPRAEDVFSELDGAALGALDRREATTQHHASLRYQGQGHELTVPLPSPLTPEALASAFQAAHRQRFGHDLPDQPIELVTLRSRAVAPRALAGDPAGEPEERALDVDAPTAPVTFLHGPQGPADAAVIAHEDLVPGHRVTGPAVVPAEHATTVIPPGWQAVVAQDTSLIITREGAG